MNPIPAISTAPLEYPSMDYAFLRQEGIKLLESLSGQLWTDFNTHDPGITILEQICYAITDLAYRTNYDIKDLLAIEGGDAYQSLYSPAEILTTRPVTLTDLRKVLIDIVGVKNAWFEPVENLEPGLMYDASTDNLYLETPVPQPPHREFLQLRGIYKVLIETDADLGVPASNILAEAGKRLHACRGLTQDFITPPTILPGEKITVNADIEIGAVDDPDELLAMVYHVIDNLISPHIRFYTLAEMFDQGKNIDEILDGPLLQNGFINDDELELLERKVGLRTSDIIQEIMKIEGITGVNTIQISNGKQTEAWYLNLDPASTPLLDMNASTIRLVRGGINVQPKPDRVNRIVNALQAQVEKKPLLRSQQDILLPAGRDRKVSQYYSIQQQFPETYGIGAMGLPGSASNERKAHAKQLKAYLMFFDQLLANYFSQLGNAKELFSFFSQKSTTYFSQVIDDASLGLDEILVNSPDVYKTRVQAIAEDPSSTNEPASPSGRKNRFLNHLLARFAEEFTDYSLLLFAQLNEADLVQSVCAFLQDYREIGAARGTGFNYTLPAWDTENISGLEKRISRKLGLSSYHKRNLSGLSADDEGGFHMLEHILLRPSLADQKQWAQTAIGTSWQNGAFLALPQQKDPYSQQISFIFPNWIRRFAGSAFSDLIEKTLREETPAHIGVRVHWLNQNKMKAFESAQKDWLDNEMTGRLWDQSEIPANDNTTQMIYIKFRDARDRMVEILEIGTPYPLRDLILSYQATIALKYSAQIQILGGQVGIRYQLCDEDGNLVTDDAGNTFEIAPQEDQPEDQIFLQTPPIQADVTYTIRAVRVGTDLETYLNQTVSIKVGINTALKVTIQPVSANQIVNGNQVTIDYSDPINLTVSQTQDGISYKLVTGPDDSPTALSAAIKGNKADISLAPTSGLTEDIVIKILAYRTNASKVSALLDTSIIVKVRPNPAITVSVDASIVDYNTSSVLRLVDSQASAEYRLYKRVLTAVEYLPAAVNDNLVVQTNEGRQVYIQAPAKITDWNNLSGFVLVDTFTQSGGSLPVSTGDLLEDTIFIIQATKTENREQIQLNQAATILVRPNPAPIVSVENAAVATGDSGVVTVNGTQQGVAYQLRADSDNHLVNPPGYHLTDRGLETTRVEVDFVVEQQRDPILLLPTEPITKLSTFNILAIKTLTGVSAELTGKATIDIAANSPG